MKYADLLKQYIKESRLSLAEIASKLTPYGFNTDKAYLSRLQNGKVNPASDELNEAIAKITGGEPEALKMAAYYEKAPKEVRETIDRGNYYDRFFDLFLKFGEGELPKELSEEMIEDILNHGSLSLTESGPLMEKHLRNIYEQEPDRFAKLIESSKRLGMIGIDASHALRLRKLREENNISFQEIADGLGITVEQYLTLERFGGITIKLPDRESQLVNINNAYDFAIKVVEQAIKIENAKENNKEQVFTPINSDTMLQIPVLGSIRAGEPIERIEFIEGYTLVDPDLLRGREGFALRIKGDSMIGDRIHEGDIVIVVKQEEVQPHEIAVVTVDNDDATLKRVKQQGDMCMLIPSNPAMTPDLVPCSKIKIIGKVVEVKFWPK